MISIRLSARLLLGCCCMAMGLGMQTVQAGELKFRVQLIWGTKGDKAKDPTKEDPFVLSPAKDDKAKDVAQNGEESAKDKDNSGKKALIDDKAKEGPLKEVDPKLAENLKKVFKWDHYFEMFRKEPVLVREGVAEKLRLSKKCEVEIKNLGKSMLEVNVFGEGKLVKTVKQLFTPRELVIGGDDPKNDTAWFVVLTPL